MHKHRPPAAQNLVVHLYDVDMLALVPHWRPLYETLQLPYNRVDFSPEARRFPDLITTIRDSAPILWTISMLLNGKNSRSNVESSQQLRGPILESMRAASWLLNMYKVRGDRI